MCHYFNSLFILHFVAIQYHLLLSNDLGGRNLDGHPIIYFPSDTLQELQQCAKGDLLLLLQYYAKIASPKIAILVDMRTKWTESDIIKVITEFDELQVTNRARLVAEMILNAGN